MRIGLFFSSILTVTFYEQLYSITVVWLVWNFVYQQSGWWLNYVYYWTGFIAIVCVVYMFIDLRVELHIVACSRFFEFVYHCCFVTSLSPQNHCILVCNSAPYQLTSQESFNYGQLTCEQMVLKFVEVRKWIASLICLDTVYCFIAFLLNRVLLKQHDNSHLTTLWMNR